jgi:hypothetical protein
MKLDKGLCSELAPRRLSTEHTALPHDSGIFEDRHTFWGRLDMVKRDEFEALNNSSFLETSVSLDV